MKLTDDDLKRIRLIVREEVRTAIGLNLARNSHVSALSGVDLDVCDRAERPMLTEPTVKASGIVADRALGPDELSKMLGYSRNTLKQMRAKQSPLIAGLPMFKLCDCESVRRKTQARCSHAYYAWESDVQAFFKARQERYGQMTVKFPGEGIDSGC